MIYAISTESINKNSEELINIQRIKGEHNPKSTLEIVRLYNMLIKIMILVERFNSEFKQVLGEE